MQVIKQNNLEVAFVHLGYRVAPGIATIWEEGEDGDKLTEDYLKDLDIVAKDGIKLVCMHVTKSSKNSPMTEIGITRWKKIISHAEKLGITVALENTKWPGYLEFIFKHIQSPNLKVCLDSGHNHVHFKDTFDFEKFADKIACVHLHDNDGTADQHLLPFDGTINWKDLTAKLKQAGYEGDMTSESVYKGKYESQMAPLEFFVEAKARLHKLEEELSK